MNGSIRGEIAIFAEYEHAASRLSSCYSRAVEASARLFEMCCHILSWFMLRACISTCNRKQSQKPYLTPRVPTLSDAFQYLVQVIKICYRFRLGILLTTTNQNAPSVGKASVS